MNELFLRRYGGAWGNLEDYDITSLFVCADCGAVVHCRGVEAHNRWHEGANDAVS